MQIETYVVHLVRQIAQDYISRHVPKSLDDIEGWQRLLNMDEENVRKARAVIDRITWEEDVRTYSHFQQPWTDNEPI